MGRNRNLMLVLLAFIFMVSQDSNASILSRFRKLGNNSKQISPSPSPSSPRPHSDRLSIENCTSSLETCSDKAHINITACLFSSSNGAKNELFLLVQNQGDSPVEVNVTINTTAQKIPIPTHDTNKVNVTDGRSSPIVLTAGNNSACVIHLIWLAPSNKFFRHFPNYTGYATPLNGVYLLALSALIFGGTWACCVLGKKERRVDGVPYQELEMGRAESPSGTNGESDDHWDQGWGDDWGEIKAVRSPKVQQIGNASTNGNTSSRSLDRDGWEDSWDD